MNRGDTFFVRTMGTTKEIASRFDAMANYPATTVIAFRRERVDRTLEAVKVVGDAIRHDFQRLIVFVTTDFTLMHESLPV